MARGGGWWRLVEKLSDLGDRAARRLAVGLRKASRGRSVAAVIGRTVGRVLGRAAAPTKAGRRPGAERRLKQAATRQRREIAAAKKAGVQEAIREADRRYRVLQRQAKAEAKARAREINLAPLAEQHRAREAAGLMGSSAPIPPPAPQTPTARQIPGSVPAPAAAEPAYQPATPGPGFTTPPVAQSADDPGANASRAAEIQGKARAFKAEMQRRAAAARRLPTPSAPAASPAKFDPADPEWQRREGEREDEIERRHLAAAMVKARWRVPKTMLATESPAEDRKRAIGEAQQRERAAAEKVRRGRFIAEAQGRERAQQDEIRRSRAAEEAAAPEAAPAEAAATPAEAATAVPATTARRRRRLPKGGLEAAEGAEAAGAAEAAGGEGGGAAEAAGGGGSERLLAEAVRLLKELLDETRAAREGREGKEGPETPPSAAKPTDAGGEGGGMQQMQETMGAFKDMMGNFAEGE